MTWRYIITFLFLIVLSFTSCYRECPKCEGEGYAYYECERCYGYGMIGCEDCNERGIVYCSNCRGQKSFICQMCYGQGYERCIMSSGTGHDMICISWDGTGYDGQWKCRRCLGSG